MRHLDVAIFATATAGFIALILLAPFGPKPKCFKDATSPIFCKVTR